MKHSVKITLILLTMFFLAQLIGLFIIGSYSPKSQVILDENGTAHNVTSYNLPYGMEPPQGLNPDMSLISIIFAIILAVVVMFLLMHFGAATILRFWFFFVIALALGITFNVFLSSIQYSAYIAIFIGIIFAYFKVFKRNIFVHNTTELFIYPGIAAIFVPLLNIWTICILLIFISLYDMYAVWQAGFMQKMAKYQIKTLRIFSGFYIPYIGKKQRELLKNSKNSKTSNNKNMKINIAILGGGDIVFPMILAGVVLNTLGLFQAIIIAIGATLALGYLFYVSEKGKFYPAMPFITIGCFIALLISYLI
jgi:presenilin-like A22 family membrane protease